MTLLEATRKRIDELCKLNNMNINQLAIASGINPSTIRSIFKVIKKAPSSDTIYYICIGLGISIKDFYDSKLFDDLNMNYNTRGESLSIEMFAEISNYIVNNKI